MATSRRTFGGTRNTECPPGRCHVPNLPSTGNFISPVAGRPGSSEVPRNPLTRWDVSSIPANGIFLTKKLKNKNKNAQRVEND